MADMLGFSAWQSGGVKINVRTGAPYLRYGQTLTDFLARPWPKFWSDILVRTKKHYKTIALFKHFPGQKVVSHVVACALVALAAAWITKEYVLI